MRDIRIAVAAMRAVVGDKAGNLERLRVLAAAAAARGAELLVLPEACLTGYTVRRPMNEWAEPVPGPLTRALTELAGELNLTLSAGLVESGPERLYLTQVMVDGTGVKAAYRKTHLGPTERELFSPGADISVVSHGGINYGLQLCYEGHFPEISLKQALGGAEILLVPHASPREEAGQKLDRWLRYLPARAYDNSVFLAACNQAGGNGDGLDFAGVAVVCGPKGEILAQAAGDEDTLVTADLKAADLTAVRQSRMGFFLPQRRPDLYSSG